MVISKVVACGSAKEVEGRIVAITGGYCLADETKYDEDVADYGSPLFF